jgi:23S rRNA (adenine2503-C2)-methyltransferase
MIMSGSAHVLKDMTFRELEEYVVSLGEKKFRAKQIFKRMYEGASSADEFTDLPKKLRERLEEEASFSAVKMRTRQISFDGTRKYLFDVAGGDAVESVLMHYKYGWSVCISSQAGCRMGCAFCASGISGLSRSLTAGEIVDQIVSVSRDAGERVSHVVVMGIGEPFDNYDNLINAIEIMHDERGLGIGSRNITVSTCGLVDKIYRFAEDMPQVGLAVSLHAPNDDIRHKLMPISGRYSMDELLKACRDYTRTTHRRITFEYALIDGINDSNENAAELAARLRGMLCHVNLIPVNSVKEKKFSPGRRQRADAFVDILGRAGITATIRRQLGADISAACGQLRLQESEKENR